MIAYVRGILEGMEEDRIIVDVGGIGYGIYMSGTAMGRLPGIGKEVKVHTYMHDMVTVVEIAKEFDILVTIDHAQGIGRAHV